MKKFFKNPYNIALVCAVGVFVVCLILAQWVKFFMYATLLVLALLCFYLSFYIAKVYKSKEDKYKEFFEDEEEGQKKTMLQRESAINRKLFIYGFLIVGVILVYMFIAML